MRSRDGGCAPGAVPKNAVELSLRSALSAVSWRASLPASDACPPPLARKSVTKSQQAGDHGPS